MPETDPEMTSLGLMSGTSLDGIDMAVLRTDGHRHMVAGRHGFAAYTPTLRRQLRAAMDMAASLPLAVVSDAAAWPTDLHEAEQAVTAAHAAAVQDFLADGPRPEIVGFHGQTVLHRPDAAFTLQLGDGAGLAARLGIDVVARFRQADMAAGGEGAPLAPLFHAALADNVRPQAVLNLGGVGNVTWLGAAEAVLAFDTGPANAPVDDFVQARTGRPYDEEGALAAAGHVDEALLSGWLSDAYFDRPPPKSLDRQGFDLSAADALSTADGAATLTAFSAACVAQALAQCPEKPKRLIVCGGGRHNATLCAMLAERCAVEIVDCDTFGWPGDALEAQAFAWLAVRSCKGLPLSRPETTGVGRPVSGGVFYPA